MNVAIDTFIDLTHGRGVIARGGADQGVGRGVEVLDGATLPEELRVGVVAEALAMPLTGMKLERGDNAVFGGAGRHGRAHDDNMGARACA